MDFGKLLKWAVIIAILFFGWKTFGPAIREKIGSSKSSSSAESNAAGSCADGAARASEAWGSGLGRFVNPPYDLEAWGSFRGDVEAKIAKAQAECGCASESCAKAKNALGDLRTLIAELDSSIRSGMPPPGDAVQRQEAIDNAIESARDLARAEQ